MHAFVTRFAPSPTGRLHLGHAYSALIALDAAREAGGRCLVRIEDIDETRCRPEHERAIIEDLAWLGLDLHERPLRQSERFAEYAGALQRLVEHGLAYRCFKTRKEVVAEIARAPHLSVDGPEACPEGAPYFGGPLPSEDEAARLAAGEPFAWRLSLAAARAHLGAAADDLKITLETPALARWGSVERACFKARPERFGDAVIARKDAGAGYHLASVYDDAAQGVTHVIRGDDLAGAAHLHRLLQALLDLPPTVYRHHGLILGEDGKRLAKRDAAATLAALRAAGETPDRLRARLGL